MVDTSDQVLFFIAVALLALGITLSVYVLYLVLAPAALADTCDEAQLLRKQSFWRGMLAGLLAVICFAIGVPLFADSFRKVFGKFEPLQGS